MSLREVGPGKPYATIQAALDNLYITVGAAAFTETHTIQIYTATYTELVTPHAALNPNATFRLIIKAAPGNFPIVDGQNIRTIGIYTYLVDFVTIDGIEVKRCTAYAIYILSNTDNIIMNCNVNYNGTYGITVQSTNNTIIHDNIGNNNGSAIWQGTAANNSKIYNNTFHDDFGGITDYSTNAEIYGNYFYNESIALYMVATVASTTKIYNNRIKSSAQHGVNLYAGTTGVKVYNNIFINNAYGINLIGASNFIYNNTFYNLAANLGIYWSGANNTVKNNIFYIAGVNGICLQVVATGQVGIISNYNLFYAPAGNVGWWQGVGYIITLASWKTTTGQDNNSISQNPLLENAGGTPAADYKLMLGSPCINTGTDLSAIFTTDFNSKSRPKGTAFDIGAFEYPAITLTGILSDYSIGQADYTQATATITGTATSVFVVINGKIFSLVATGGGIYTLAIRGFDIGICAGASVIFFAFNDDYNIQYTAATITVAATANYNIDAIEVSIINILNTITDFKSVLQHEPKQIPQLPATTLYYDGFNQTQTEAVSFTITHKWILRIYVKLHDAEDAQIQLKDLVGKVLAALKLDLDFGNTVLFGFTDSGTVSVLMDRDNPVMVAELNLTALLEVD